MIALKYKGLQRNKMEGQLIEGFKSNIRRLQKDRSIMHYSIQHCIWIEITGRLVIYLGNYRAVDFKDLPNHAKKVYIDYVRQYCNNYIYQKFKVYYNL